MDNERICMDLMDITGTISMGGRTMYYALKSQKGLTTKIIDSLKPFMIRKNCLHLL
jgi:hypothetical protein